MSEFTNDPGHGHSPAAWTAVLIILVGASLGTTFFVLSQPVWVWGSVVITALGPVVGYLLAKAGYGVNGPKYQPKEH